VDPSWAVAMLLFMHTPSLPPRAMLTQPLHLHVHALPSHLCNSQSNAVAYIVATYLQCMLPVFNKGARVKGRRVLNEANCMQQVQHCQAGFEAVVWEGMVGG